MVATHPELVVQRPHERSFEDTLRELVRDAPYLFVALVLHAVVIFVFAMIETPAMVTDPIRQITMTPKPEVPPLPPEPIPPEPVIEPPTEPIIDPVIAKEDVPDAEPDLPLAPDTGPVDDNPLPMILGPGPGGGSTHYGDRPGPGIGGPPGAGDATNEAVNRGLRWLAKHQTSEGHWSTAAFDLECGKLGDDTICDGVGSPQYDVGVTGLSLLAFLGAGHTDKRGDFRKTVKAGLRFLVDVQDGDGVFAGGTGSQYPYDHAIATLALVEATALSGSYPIKQAAKRALEHLYLLRQPGAGWRYADFHPEMTDPRHRSDTSVTGWAILAITSAKEIPGLPYDAVALDDAMLFLEEMTDRDTGRTGYIEAGSYPAREADRAEFWPDRQSESLTAVAVLCRVFADPDLEIAGNRDMIEKGAALIGALPPLWNDDEPGRRDLYYWYYGAMALYQAQELDQKPWKRWEQAIVSEIVPHQHLQGERTGSWDPQVDPWGHLGGRVYSTAIMTLTLEAYYRYGRVLTPGRGR